MSPRQPDPRSPRPLDRALSLPLLETVYRIASLDLKAEERSAQLTIALREHTTDADAKSRVKCAVSRIWINPPQPAAAMIRWAIDNPEHFPDRRLMHTGALLATVPFVGSVLGHLGSSFALDQTLTVPDLRRRVVARWGQTSTVSEGVGKTITSLRRLGVVEGGGRRPITRCSPLATSPLSAAWLVHAVMLCRHAESLEVREAAGVPELFWADQGMPDPSYPHLELHTEALNRRVWVPV
ncbi:hypothetical protein [Candidatus Poriferisodalis sp.]|uniref:hypothetical protein n=1 Tax=Candidatus Poriferisodalis sp. TaxID=3101277 RepID=UPI003B01D742